MPATGVEVGVAYVSVVPSAANFGRALRTEIGPDRLGRQIGSEINSGLSSQLDRVDIGGNRLVNQARDGGEKAGKAAGSALSGHIGSGVDTALGSLKRLSVGLIGAAGGAFFIGKQFFDAASDLNESASKTRVVFGDAFDTIDRMAQNSATSMGLSRQAALEAASTFGNLFRSMGIGVDVSADMSTKLLQLAGDLASFNNVDPTEALEALRSGLVGETEPLRRFGVNINEARIQAEALRLGLTRSNVNMADVNSATIRLEKAQAKQADTLKKAGANSLEYRDASAEVANAQADLEKKMAGTKVELDAAQKAQATYSLIMKDTSLAQGDFSRTADGAANKQRILAAEWENAKARIGTALQPIGITFLDLATKGLDGISSWWQTNGPTVSGWFDTLKTKFFDIFGPDPVANFQAGAAIIRDWWNRLFGSGTDNPAVNGPNVLDNIRLKLDEIFGPDKAASFQAGADLLRTKFDELWADFERGAVIVNERLGPAWDFIGRSVLWLRDEVLDPFIGWMAEHNPLENMADKAQTVVEAFDRLWRAGEASFNLLREKFLDPLIGTAQTVAGWGSSLRDAFIGGIKGFAVAWNSLQIPQFGPWEVGFDWGPKYTIGPFGPWDFPDIPLNFATGGVVPGPRGAPQLAVVHGGETIVPHSASYAAPTAGVAGMQIGSIVVSGQREPDQTAWAIRRELRRVAYFAGAA